MLLRQSVSDARPSVSNSRAYARALMPCSRVQRGAARCCASVLLALVHALSLASCASSGVRTADAAMYVRADTDNIMVYAPRTSLGAKVGDGLTLGASYAVDVWTGASIDVVTAATTAITEDRHEANASMGYEFKDVTISGSYRYSTEHDYWSNGGVLNLVVDLFDNNTTLGVSAIGAMDIVGRARTPDFRRPQNSIGGRLTFSQVLDTKTVLSASAELMRLRGYLASPYRMVGLGRMGLCGNPTRLDADAPSAVSTEALDCLPENHPHERLRTALALKLRRAFGAYVSIGLDYRYYFDDWGIDSHTPTLDLAFLLGAHGTLSLAYRFYIQSRSDFYEERYTRPAGSYYYFSRDRKMSAMSIHHVGLEYTHDFELGESANTLLTLGLRAGVSRFFYTEFVGLTMVDALEATGMLGLSFR